jgi:hypothetical protein
MYKSNFRVLWGAFVLWGQKNRLADFSKVRLDGAMIEVT